jgi:hypothetical protein
MSSTILGGDVTVYWSTDNNQKRWEWTGSATGTRSMNEVYSAWKTLEALSANMSELVGMTAQTPVDYTGTNGFFVDDTTMEHMTGGTFQSSGWASLVVLQKPYDKAGGAATDFVAGDIGKTIVGTTTTHSGTILDFNTVVANEFVVIRPDDPATDLFNNNTEAYTVTTGTGAAIFAGASVSGESIWANPNTIASLASNTLVYIYQSRSITAATAGADDRAKVTAIKGTDSWWGEGNIDICLKIQEMGQVFDEGYATFFAHQYTQGYAHAVVDLSAGARTPIALETADDINNNSGHRQFLTNAETGGGWSSADIGVRINENIATPTWEAVLTSVTGTGPNYTMQYYPVATLTDASATDVFEDLAATKTATITGAAPTGVGPQSSPASTITITHANITRDLNNGNGSQPYSIEADLQATPINGWYELGKYQCKRGITATGLTDGIEGEQYIGNELHLNTSGGAGTITEGEQVWCHDSGNVLVATGMVVANHGVSNDGGIQLRNLRRYTANTITQVGDNITQASYTDWHVVDTERAITPVKVAPLGTFAGGVYFGPPGMWILDLFAGDEQAFQLTDDLGNPQSPPNTVSILVTNLTSGNSVAVYRRVSAVAGSDINRAEYNPNATQGPINDTTAGDVDLDVTGAISNEVPDAGKVKVVDVSDNNSTLRYRYTSVTRAAPGKFVFGTSTGTADAGGSATRLVDAAADFVTDGVEVGDVARNITDGTGVAIVTNVVDLNNLDTTTLAGGTSNDWATGDSYEINTLAAQYVTGDDVWVPFIDRVADATTESNSIIHSVDIPVRVVVREPGTLEPQSFDQTITSTGMTQANIITADSIYTP